MTHLTIFSHFLVHAGVVPFYGMAKRSGGAPQSSDNYGFLPGSYYDNLRGDSSYNIYKRGLPINNVGFLPGGGLLDEYRGESSKRGLPINNVGFFPGGGLLDDYRGDSSANVYKRGLPINSVGFLPGGGLLDDYRGDSLYSNMYRRSGGGNVPMGEMRKRGDYLATYCCVGLQDDDCCDLIGEPEPENDWEEEEAYELFDEDSCLICLHKDSFDYEYCLQCVKKRK